MVSKTTSCKEKLTIQTHFEMFDLGRYLTWVNAFDNIC